MGKSHDIYNMALVFALNFSTCYASKLTTLEHLHLYSYRKALRMMYYADHHGFPIVTFIDTPGAYADLKSEELGQVCG